MRIEKFEDLAVAIDDKIAIWFRRYIMSGRALWCFSKAKEGDKEWYNVDEFDNAHPGILNDIFRRLDKNE